MRRTLAILGISGFSMLYAGSVVFATDASSANYQNLNSSIAPAAFTVNSSNYTVSASVEAITGKATSASFSMQMGIPLPGTVPSSGSSGSGSSGGSGGGSGGGGSGPAAVDPTLEYRNSTFLSHQVIGGHRDQNSVSISVNGSTQGVTFLDPFRWQFDLPLFLGVNDVFVQSRTTTQSSQVITGHIERLLAGDINTSHFVDDVDLSLFTRAWKKYTPFADFNEDNKIDDVDLSLLASHWGASY